MADACCAIDCDEWADVGRVESVRARKAHSCTECNRPIAQGTAYERASMLFDGRWTHWKTCWFCCALIRDYCGGVQIYGNLSEILWDCLDYDLVNDRFRDE